MKQINHIKTESNQILNETIEILRVFKWDEKQNISPDQKRMLNEDSIRTRYYQLSNDSAELGLAYIKDIKKHINHLIDSISVAKMKAEQEQLATEKKLNEENFKRALKKLRSRYDDMKEITWYYDKNTTSYSNVNGFYIYMGNDKNNRPWLRFRIQYAADDWLFIQSYIIKTDDKSYTIQPSYGEVESDNGNGGIWEWYDANMDNEKYEIVKSIINSKKVKLRCNGKKYYDDRVISITEKQAFENILNAYQALGGSVNFN